MKRQKKTKKTDEQLSPEMVIKIRGIRPKRWRVAGRIYGKGKFLVWSGTEMKWCIVKVVVVVVVMMMNWWAKDDMTVD